MTEKRLPLKPYPLGACREGDMIRFAFASEKKKCGVIIYDRKTGRRIGRLPFTEQERVGKVYCKYVAGLNPREISYQFYKEGVAVPDEQGRGFAGKHPYGKGLEKKNLRAVLLEEAFDWDGDKAPQIPYEDCICYCLHVRGFTKHPSSGVEHRGTFLGLTEKLQYLKESGITTLELQPAYEFSELEIQEEFFHGPGREEAKGREPVKINYWGYKKGYYYAPKQGYASGEDPGLEFKELVKAAHRLGLEIVMQFYFPPEAVLSRDIPDILRFWVLEYHVDGFHLMGLKLPIEEIAEDPALADTKLWYYSFDTERLYPGQKEPEYKNLAVYQDDYMYAMRRLLKGDEDMLETALYQMRLIPEKTGRIHYFTNYYGFTLADLVAYDHKHNRENGEDNRDGNDYNCSWNCGEEGAARRKRVRSLRFRQMKNALCMLFFSQSTPLIFMGDEFGNSQRGNNNPYCQDNPTAWLNWRDLEKNRELYDFFKGLVSLRKEHSILHPAKELKVMDYLSLGYPDLSYHGENAWKPELSFYSRHIGIMYCGKYGVCGKGKEKEEPFYYFAMNMHWEYHELAMPKLPKGLSWKLLFTTAEEDERKEQTKEALRSIPPRSIAVFVSEA